LSEWQAARVVKANPDRAQIPVRANALRAGKVVYMAVPALAREYPFVRLDPGHLPEPAGQAADKDRALALGEPAHLDDVPRIDLAVAGSVAVNRDGARVGKGGGFSDIEIALLTEAGLIGPWTVIAATVHDLQVLDEPLPETAHDFRLDLVVTPTEVIRAAHPRPSPGVIWEDLDPAKIAAIPVLVSLQRPAGQRLAE
jgi:5-formyltetrahydrofolate cyclo-ligase